MFSYLKNLFNYWRGKEFEDVDEDKENFLAEQLLLLELQSQKQTLFTSAPIQDPPRNAVCFQRTGVITYIGDTYVLIDGSIYFDISACSINLNVNNKVLYLGYKDSNDAVKIVRILGNQGLYWGDEDDIEENSFDIIEHVLIGQVSYRQDRFVYITESDMRFSLDDVKGTLVPIRGDWLEMKCSVLQDEKKPSEINTNQVLKVLSFVPLRTKIKQAVVTEWSGTDGICDRQIYFDHSALFNGDQPTVGSKVLVETIESNQGKCNWRAIKLTIINIGSCKTTLQESMNEEETSLMLEREKKIDMTHPLNFEQVCFQQTGNIYLYVTNSSDQTYILNKWIMLSKKRDSQIIIEPFIYQPIKFYPEQTITFKISCNPKFLGHSKERLVILFKGFQLKRIININVIDDNKSETNHINGYYKNSHASNIETMREIRCSDNSFIPGRRQHKIPAFVAVKIGLFPIPEKIWSVVLGDSEQTIYTNEFDKILALIKINYPYLTSKLDINNYNVKWHTLLYMEEIQANLNMRVYDRKKVYLTHCDEYLGIEIPGLSEKRPSLIIGDRVIVKDVWTFNSPQYEGFIHNIRGNLVLMKFSTQFQEVYSGSDVSIEFHFSRTVYRRSHQAINLAISNLGPDILFPSRIVVKQLQIPQENIQYIEWFNPNLNTDQKYAVINILKGECRPMPYIIFGPPGTGKTVTVIETILQILKLIPESRILVATPSNSASNLLMERFIQYKGMFTGSIVRLIANHLVDSENLPYIIKPYCATVDISRENSSQSQHTIKDGINLGCSKSLIARHRVVIGTCHCLGTLKHIDLPRGHFTHIIVDEAGQASEPEIMLPLTFTDKGHGQIILAGDPMQLGPIVMSKYCSKFDMDESFLCRLLNRFPYLKDYDAFINGFDGRLITKLNENYRSLKEVLTLPSKMFYDGTLIAKINKNIPWTLKFMKATCDIFESQNIDGGIYVYGIKGCNLRAEDSPSWFNPQEASMIALTTCKLYKKNVTEDDIGIITPYLAQTKYLRVLFDSMGLAQPKIGTVEDFQGQERPIILISTVRSSESILKEDMKHALGFVKNPKRLNVALTRAQVSVILFCNPHLLSQDPLWKKVIDYAVTQEKYMGCDLPHIYDEKTNIKE